MATIQNKEQGFIFVKHGRYARIVNMQTIRGKGCLDILWTDDIDRAHLFPHEHMARRNWPNSLKDAEAFKAIATRTVVVEEW